MKNTQYLKKIENMVNLFDSSNIKTLKIIVVGKYTKLSDTYLSIRRALEHASLKNNCKVNIDCISSEIFSGNNPDFEIIKNSNAVIIPGGFGIRGIEGMINIARFCRKNDIPMLGICLGMHIMCIESARNVLGENCNSKEFDTNTQHPIILNIEELCKDKMGGTMKLGIKETIIDDKYYSISKKIYDKLVIRERHRHRYEVNQKYIKIIEKDGLCFVGTDINKQCMDIVEDLKCKFYVGCQFHPEFLSSIETPAPLFDKFIAVSL